MDGCGYIRFVWSILIPLIKPAIATVTVIHAIGIWNELILANVYLTNEDLFPITKGLIVFEGVYGSDWPKLAAAVLMLMFPMLVLFMFLQRYIISGLTSGAVKGSWNREGGVMKHEQGVRSLLDSCQRRRLIVVSACGSRNSQDDAGRHVRRSAGDRPPATVAPATAGADNRSPDDDHSNAGPDSDRRPRGHGTGLERRVRR